MRLKVYIIIAVATLIFNLAIIILEYNVNKEINTIGNNNKVKSINSRKVKKIEKKNANK